MATSLRPFNLAFPGTAAVLAVAILVGSIPPAAVPTIPPVGAVTLQRGEQPLTEWVEVPAGMQARWQWDANDYVNFDVEGRGYGVLASDDAYGAIGCVRAEAPFAVRMWWSWNVLGARSVMINYSIIVAPGNASCATARELRELRGPISPPGELLPPGGVRVFLPPLAASAACIPLIAYTRRWAKAERLATVEHPDTMAAVASKPVDGGEEKAVRQPPVILGVPDADNETKV